jgi:hypothetical protein
MNQTFKKKGLTVPDSAEEPSVIPRNPRPDKSGQKALTVVQDLSWGSFLPLFSAYLKYGPILIYYMRTSRGGLRLSALLCFLKISISAPLKINDLFYIDTPHVIYWNTQYQVVKACQDQLDRIKALIEAHFPKCSNYMRELLAANVSKAWQAWLLEALLLRGVAKQLGQQEGISNDCVVLISKYASLLKLLKLDSPANSNVSISSQLNNNGAVLYPLATIAFSVWDFLLVLFRSIFPGTILSPESADQFKVGVAAAWGIEGMNKNQKDDLYWWRNSSVAAKRLVYMFEREDIQPTQDRVRETQNLGIQSVALKPRFSGDHPNLIMKYKCAPPLVISLRKCGTALKLGCKALVGDEFSKAVLALVSWQYYSGGKLSEIYKALNLKGVFHFEEAGMDLISLASAMNDSMRIGTHWSSHTSINHTTQRSHQVYFLWGHHDAQIVLGSGSISHSLLIAGCFLSDHSNKEAQQDAKVAVEKIRNRGVRYILTLLDNSSPCPEFYRFFLQWLVEDPCLGLLIKSKGKSWKEVRNDGMNGLVERAEKTNRIYVMDHRSSPSDAALLSDFAVSLTSISALIEASLQGARVIYLDYERIDQGPQKPYCILHSLGSNRCVFHEPDLLRQAIVNYFDAPDSNPNLGDVTPILDQLDPFRDGKASQRIGEFVTWYLESLDGGLNSDDSIRSAMDKYAGKWGQDKIVRSLQDD